MEPTRVGVIGSGDVGRALAAGTFAAAAEAGEIVMVDPALPDGPHPMFIAGDDADAKATVGEVLDDFGWKAFDVGGIEQARQLESLCLLWVAVGQRRDAWNHAFTLVGPSA
jgi:hypothetical protein